MYPSSLRISRESYALPRTSSSTLFSLAWRLWRSGRRSGRQRGRRIGGTGGMEGQHVALHAKLDPAHSVRHGFVQGPPISPAIVCDAVAGDDRAGAVIACYRITHDGWTNRRALHEAVSYGMSWIEFGMQRYVLAFHAAGAANAPPALPPAPPPAAPQSPR